MATWGKNSYTQTYTINGSELFILDTGTDTVVCTANTFVTSNNPTIRGIVKESITTLTGTSNALVNTNNSIMTWSLSGTSTLTDSLNSGESCSLLLTYNSNSITLPTISWYGGLTTPTNQTKVRFYFEKIGTTLYGSWLSA